MTYLRIAISHISPSVPSEIFSELDEERYEARKVEVFRDGTLHYAGPGVQSGPRGLSENSFPGEEFILTSSELSILPTSAEDFERLWRSALISAAA